MPKLKENQIPSYRLHKQSGQAIVTLNGKDHLLGPFNSEASKSKYKRLTSEWLGGGSIINTAVAGGEDLSVMELIRDFLRHARTYYRRADRSSTGETDNFIDALRPLKDLYGRTAARDFDTPQLEAVRHEMIRRRWCRTNINRQVNRIRHVFKWGAKKKLVPASIYHELQTLSALEVGRSDAKESVPVKPVSDGMVDAIKTFVSRQVWAMIELQRLTGMRPGEIVSLRCRYLNRDGNIWLYTPAQHKTAHRGHKRIIYLGPQAQEIVKPFLKLNPDAFLFSPAEAEEERRAKLAENRKTPLNRGNTSGTNRRRKPRKSPGQGYTVESYGRAIKDACTWAFEMPAEMREKRRDKEAEAKLSEQERAELAKTRAHRSTQRTEWRRQNCWHPHQLRHSAATRWRATHGPEITLVLLGDKTTSMVDVYAEKDHVAAQQVAMKIG